MTNTKNKRVKKNKTRKLSTYEVQKFCKASANTFSQFEDDYEKTEVFLKKGEITKNQVEERLIKLINQGIKNKLSPNDDFYTFINNVWVKDFNITKEQKYIIQLDDFRLVQYKVYKELIEIMNEYIKHNKTPLARNLKSFYDSVIAGVNEVLFNKYVKEFIETLDELRTDKKNLWKLLALINRNGFVNTESPFLFKMEPDEKNSQVFRPYIHLPKLSLIDTIVYINNGTDKKYKNNIIKHYISFIRKLSNIKLNDSDVNNKIIPKNVFDVEYDLLSSIGCDTIKMTSTENYNKVTRKDALEKYGFNWDEYAKELGFKIIPEFFIIGNLNYLKCATELLSENWISDKWRSYWIYLFVKQISRSYEKTNFYYFNFFTKFLKGQDVINFSVSGIAYTTLAFNTFFTNKYIEKYKKKENIDYVSNMAHDLLAVFKRTIRNNIWLSSKSKEMALLKLDTMKLIIGSSKSIQKDPIIEYDNNDFWGNMNKLFSWRMDQELSLNGKPVFDIPYLDFSESPAKFIGKQAYVVNAFYTPSENSIYVPLAYIQKPFVDLGERGIEYNLAHIGFTLAHEMSHSLDNIGSNYDNNGNLYNWWTDHDRKIFNKKQQDVINQYEAFALQDGIKFNAKPSIGEDLADISGLVICEEYLRDFQDKNEDIVPIRVFSFKTFFVYYAFQMRQKINKKAISTQLLTNPHPQSKYRTNIPLSRLELFRALYSIKKGDKMYWPSTDKIW